MVLFSSALLGALQNIPCLYVDKLPIAALTLDQTARLMVEARTPRGQRPLCMTSVNGEVLARCHNNLQMTALLKGADVISADGQPLVVVSRWMTTRPLPERVATTDLFPVVARMAEEQGLSFYMLGADESENAKAVQEVRKAFPRLNIVGACHGYLDEGRLLDTVREINALAPDILWVALGVPYEQMFMRKYAHLLKNVGVIKTSGGLFNFLSKSRKRAPQWMQRWSLEWLWRLLLEPRRLFWRYCVTNPKALYILFTQMR